MNRQQTWGVAAVLGVMFVALMMWPTAAEQPDAPEPEPAVVVKPAPAVPVAEAEPVIERMRTAATVTEPEGDEMAEHMDPVTRQTYNVAVSDAIVDLRVACLDVVVEEGDLLPTDEFVFDAVVVGGEIIDIKIRALTDVSKDTLDCVHNAAWDAGWPKIKVSGEMRFQRVFRAQ